MEEYDLRLDLPSRAHINAQLLELIERGATFLEAKKHLFTTHPLYRDHQFDIYGWTLNDPSQLLGMLYCEVVLPRELLQLPANHAIYAQLEAAGLPSLFQIIKPANCGAFLLIRGLRHAAAHVLFEIYVERGQVMYRFWNDRGEFEVRTEHGLLVNAVRLIGAHLGSNALQRKPRS